MKREATITENGRTWVPLVSDNGEKFMCRLALNRYGEEVLVGSVEMGHKIQTTFGYNTEEYPDAYLLDNAVVAYEDELSLEYTDIDLQAELSCDYPHIFDPEYDDSDKEDNWDEED